MKTETIHETREQWLTAAVEMFRRDIDLQILLMEDSDKRSRFQMRTVSVMSNGRQRFLKSCA